MSKKPTLAKKSVAKKTAASKNNKNAYQSKWRHFSQSLYERLAVFKARRPHRSFRLTRRRDYARSLTLPGYWSFTNHVRKTIVANKRLFLSIAIFYGLLTALLIGFASQDNYMYFSDILRNLGGEILNGAWGELGKASLLVASGVTGSFSNPLSEIQQVYTVIIILLTWLTTVWLLRAVMTGSKPKFRDGLYSAGAPIIPTFMVLLAAVVQLLPVAIAAAGFAAAIASGLLEENGVESMVFWTAIVGLLGLSLYWMTSTFMALIVVTLPGMYPWNALKIAGDMVVGRRLRILLRILWMVLMAAIVWFVIMVPLILFDTWLKGVWPAIEWLPLVPIVMLILSSCTVVWIASYVYLLYRKVVDDDSNPA